MKVAVVTGGSRGIGESIVRRLSSDGYTVVFSYLNSEGKARLLAEEVGGIAVKSNVAMEQECVALVQAAIQRFGRIDVLVNNAGVAYSGLVTDMNSEDISSIFGININGTIYMCQAVLPHMVSAKCGAIINVSSIFGVRGASCEAVYSASKSAIIGFTQALAREVGLSGIRVNAVAPGVVHTDMTKDLSEQDLLELKNATALGRIGRAEEIASVVSFLCSEQASYITAQCIVVDGGII